jgi:hypothetical protein
MTWMVIIKLLKRKNQRNAAISISNSFCLCNRSIIRLLFWLIRICVIDTTFEVDHAPNLAAVTAAKNKATSLNTAMGNLKHALAEKLFKSVKLPMSDFAVCFAAANFSSPFNADFALFTWLAFWLVSDAEGIISATNNPEMNPDTINQKASQVNSAKSAFGAWSTSAFAAVRCALFKSVKLPMSDFAVCFAAANLLVQRITLKWIQIRLIKKRAKWTVRSLHWTVMKN